MTENPDIPHGSSAIIDSSVLFAIGAPDNEKYQAFQRFVTQQDLSVYIPTHVAEELGEAPDAYTFHRERLRAAQEAGWLERAEIDYENPTVSNVIDRTRKRMVNLSANDVTEDEIEKTDTVLAGLAYHYANYPQAHVTIFVSLAILILHPIYTVLTGGILFETVGGILLLGVHFSFGLVWCCAYIMHLLAEYHTDSMVVNWDG